MSLHDQNVPPEQEIEAVIHNYWIDQTQKNPPPEERPAEPLASVHETSRALSSQKKILPEGGQPCGPEEAQSPPPSLSGVGDERDHPATLPLASPGAGSRFGEDHTPQVIPAKAGIQRIDAAEEASPARKVSGRRLIPNCLHGEEVRVTRAARLASRGPTHADHQMDSQGERLRQAVDRKRRVITGLLPMLGLAQGCGSNHTHPTSGGAVGSEKRPLKNRKTKLTSLLESTKRSKNKAKTKLNKAEFAGVEPSASPSSPLESAKGARRTREKQKSKLKQG